MNKENKSQSFDIDDCDRVAKIIIGILANENVPVWRWEYIEEHVRAYIGKQLIQSAD